MARSLRWISINREALSKHDSLSACRWVRVYHVHVRVLYQFSKYAAYYGHEFLRADKICTQVWNKHILPLSFNVVKIFDRKNLLYIDRGEILRKKNHQLLTLDYWLVKSVPNFVEKTYSGGCQTSKFAKVLSQNFPTILGRGGGRVKNFPKAPCEFCRWGCTTSFHLVQL